MHIVVRFNTSFCLHFRVATEYKQNIITPKVRFPTLQPHGTPRTFMKELRLWIDPAEKPSGSEPTGLGTRTGRSTGSSG